MKQIVVAYVCVHNSCRSQMAEAITREIAGEFFTPYSAGTETKPQINQDAVRIIEEMYGVDMNQSQTSKLLSSLPKEVDILITMGCNVECPYIPTKHREDWGLEDPSGKELSAFVETAKTIHKNIETLKKRIEEGIIQL